MTCSPGASDGKRGTSAPPVARFCASQTRPIGLVMRVLLRHLPLHSCVPAAVSRLRLTAGGALGTSGAIEQPADQPTAAGWSSVATSVQTFTVTAIWLRRVLSGTRPHPAGHG